MNNNQRTPLSDNLISPNKTKTTQNGSVKIAQNRDGLMERVNQTIVTTDGKTLLREESEKGIL